MPDIKTGKMLFFGRGNVKMIMPDSTRNTYMTPLSYIDPSSISLLLSIVVGGVLGALFTIKIWWGRLTSNILNLFGNRNETD